MYPKRWRAGFRWPNPPFSCPTEKVLAKRQIIIAIDAFIDAADK
jgi:hypothetical protein